MNSPHSVACIPVIAWSANAAPPAAIDRGFVALTDVPTEAISAVIAEHLHSLTEHGFTYEATCPLFGGLVLAVNGRRVLYPQCCGDLSDVATWSEALREGFERGFVAGGGHPRPLVVRRGSVIEVRCADADEPFDPPVDGVIALPEADFRVALEQAEHELRAFADRIAACEPDRPHLGVLLVFGEDAAA